jgi:alpha-glucosidase
VAYSAQEGPGWRFEGNTLTTVVTVPRTAVTAAVTIRVHRSLALFERRKELDGFAGAMTRLREAYDNLNQTFPLAWSPDELVDAMQTGDRLGYYPQQAGEQLLHFREVLPQALASIKELKKTPSQAEVAELAKHFKVDPDSELVRNKLSEFQSRIVRAEAALADVLGQQ